ncbi:cytochrome P450 [Lipomyces starkeyi]
MTKTTPIPEPHGYPIIGNIPVIDPNFPLGSFVRLAEKYGEIYRLKFPGKSLVFVTTRALVHEVSDETRFRKTLGSVLGEVRNGVRDGLFTAIVPEEPNWGVAHRILMPAFGPLSIRGMFDEMHDISTQLTMKWARHGQSTPIMVTDDFTRLTLDTLALCSMGFRFNSFYHDELHPFIKAMGEFLVESGNRSRRPPLPSMFYSKSGKKYFGDIDLLRKTADEVLRSRKKTPGDRRDLLTAMLESVDPKTGQKMSDSSIIDNLITFLIAGHETTSGMLSYAFYQLLRHPTAYRKAQQEVDEVIGTGPIEVGHMSKLPYLAAVLRETLRLNATIPIIGVEPLKDEVIGGKYPLRKGEPILLLLAKSQRDPLVWGETAEDFIPTRMLEENFNAMTKEFPDCWKPFGNGMRACIGRPFAWQEALLVMAMLLQTFNFVMDDPNYQLHHKQTLTIKPRDFYMRAILRNRITPTQLEHRLKGTWPPKNQTPASSVYPTLTETKSGATRTQISIYYGSNSGTCEALAQRLAADASGHGFSARVVDSLDSANQSLPTDHPVVIITASYEGQPPDNAAHFVAWIESLNGKQMAGVSYAVFGCGHHDWSQTFHRIPKLVDSTLERLGGSRISPLGLANAAEGDMFSDFETWEDSVFWPAVAQNYGVSENQKADSLLLGIDLKVEISTPRTSVLRQDVKQALVSSRRDLTAPGEPAKVHLEIQLPANMTYCTGDYLAVLPLNPKDSIYRAMRRFLLPWDAHITISAAGNVHPTLPTDRSMAVTDILGAYVELGQPATKRNILNLIETTKDDITKKTLQKLATESYSSEISARKVSVLDLLERYPSISLPFGPFLAMLPPMRVRQYSISSSPLWNPSHVTLTFAVLDEPSFSGQGRHVGVASSYLASLSAGDKLHVSVRSSHAAFHLPRDPEHTPIICVASGTGIAPFRGFLQERSSMKSSGRTLAPAVLYFGCRDPEKDDIYRDEMDQWEAAGVVSVKRAYSRKPELSDGCAYVQDRLWKEREEVSRLWDRGAKVFVCGSRNMGEGVKKVAISIRMENSKGATEDDAKAWFEGIRNVRYAMDVFD